MSAARSSGASPGFLRRLPGHVASGGPGYLQSAMTLGGGTAVSSVFAGRMFGYDLLWVAPCGMLFGVLMLGVLARLALTADERPYAAMARAAGRAVALAWAIGTVVASVIWHFPQYALAGGALSDAAALGGSALPPWLGAAATLLLALAMSFLYGPRPGLVRAYEWIVRALIAGVVVCFALVVAETSGSTDWGAVLAGFVPSIPEPRGGIQPTTLIAGGLSSAVGINMVFLYPYSLRARGWGAGDVERARVDLVFGMLLPFTLATTLVVVATANTIPWAAGADTGATKLTPLEAAEAFGGILGNRAGRLVFDLGLFGMALSTIALHMVACGYAVAEIAGAPLHGRAYRLGTLLPIPGVLGPVLWSELVWIAVPTSVVCGLFLPLAYFGIVRWAGRSAATAGPTREGRLTRAALLALTLAFSGVMLSDLAPKIFPG
ncbi:MAG: divalent metal cation transporter [Planctomycetota bacterium]